MTAARVVYLASPIDYAQDSVVPVWREVARRNLERAGFVVYDPAEAWSVPEDTQPDSRIEKVNRVALGRCDGVLALLPDSVRSIGVPMELGTALDNGIPTASVGSVDSWALAGRPRLERFSKESIPEAVQWLSANVLTEAQQVDRIYQNMLVAGEGQMPEKAYSDDAGWDLFSSERCIIPQGHVVDVPSGVAVQLPPNMWYMIVGRSSTFRKRGLLVNTGIIDGGFRGELFATTRNVSGGAVTIEKGERIAQLIPFNNAGWNLQPVRVERLDDSDRGTKGFGSTGS